MIQDDFFFLLCSPAFAHDSLLMFVNGKLYTSIPTQSIITFKVLVDNFSQSNLSMGRVTLLSMENRIGEMSLGLVIVRNIYVFCVHIIDIYEQNFFKKNLYIHTYSLVRAVQ